MHLSQALSTALRAGHRPEGLITIASQPWKEIGRVKYDAWYLTNQWFKLAIELCCYKVQYKAATLNKYQLTEIFIGSSYNIKLSREQLIDIISKAYND